MHTRPTNQVLALRRHLANKIVCALGPGGQHCISASYGIPQPRMSELERGIVDRCTIEWLIRRIHRMGGSVSITVTLGDVRRAWFRERCSRMRSKPAGRPSGTGVSSDAKADAGR